MFTAPADVLAGVALASAFGAHAGAGPVIALLAASAAVYCAGMAANDVFDLDVDRRERPRRPIPSGRVSLAGAWGLVLGLQGLALALAAAGAGLTGVLAVGGTILCTYLYNAMLKAGPLGPVAMGACRYGNAMIGVAAAGTFPSAWPIYLIPLGVLAYVAAVTGLSRHEVDGAPRAALRVPLVAMLNLSFLAAAWPALVLPYPAAAPLALLPLAWLVRPVRRAWTAPSAGTVRGGVMAGIYGIALINAVIAAAAGGWWQAALAAGLLLPGRLFGRWFYAT